MRVVVISNDVVPAQGGLVAAPGLRAHCLAAGLSSHGIEVQTVVLEDAVARYRKAVGPLDAAAGVEVVAGTRLMRHLKSLRPVTAVMINGNQAEHLEKARGLRFVYDGFAPRLLEMVFREGSYPESSLTALAQAEGRAMRIADGVIVNGARKVPYYLAALLHAGRDVRRVPVSVVEMAVPADPAPGRSAEAPFVVALTGYRQDWNPPGPWVEELTDLLGSRLRALVVEGRHWGAGRREVVSRRWQALLAHDAVEVRPALAWSDFSALWRDVDLAIDLFERTAERELAMVTRSIIALAHGVPVVHPPFSEVSPLIEAEGAGWLVDPSVPGAVTETLEALDAEDVASKRAGAARLSANRLDPSTAVLPLLHMVEEWS